MPFQPNPNDTLDINGVTYRIAEHPVAPGMPHGQEGRAGIVYCLEAGEPSSAGTQGFVPRAALKVFKPRFRTPALVSQAERLAAYADLPGLAACRRAVLIPSRHAELLRRHPDLTYAVLMPWIEGPTWQEVLLEKRLLSPERALALAQSLANILAQLEQQGLAHCDLSAPNVILPALAQSAIRPGLARTGNPQSAIELVDLEVLYAPAFTRPPEIFSRSLGYAHPKTADSLWGPEMDRFAGAVLLAEMLGCCDPQVVQAAWGESYFDPDEMQQDCDRYRRLVDSLRFHWGEETADMFERAWRSDALADCPTFGEWLVALPEELAGKSPDRGPGWGSKETKSPIQGPEEATKHPDGEVPSDQPKPSQKGQSLEELRSQAYSFTTQGQWKEVLNICNMILSRWPDQGDIALLLFRARRLVDMDQEVEQAWLKALQSGQPADWEACWKAAQTILQQSPRTARYQEIAERAQQELEWAAIVARAEALVAENRWEEASRLLDAVPADHALAARVRAQLEVARSRERRVAELLGRAEAQIQQEAWDDAIVTCQMGLALSSSTATFHTLLERAYREREVERKVAEHRAAADRAAQAMDWEKAVAALEAALALRPQRVELRARHEQFTRYRAWASLLAEARQLLGAYAWEEAQTKLTGIPDDFMQTAALREQVERERDRKAQLDVARAAYDGETVLTLLADVNENYPQLAEWRAWARTEIERRRQLQTAKQIYDSERILALLADVDEDYPQLAEWRAWAEGEIERRRQLEAAKQACDGQAVLALLADVGPDYPDLAEWRAWAEREIERRHKLEAAQKAYDGKAVLALLADVGPGYPQLAEWRAWAEGEIARQRKLQAAKQTYDGEAVLAVLANVGPGYPDLAKWQAWAQGEIERRRKLEAAEQIYDGEQILALLSDVDEDYPQLAEWRAWAEGEIERRRKLLAARQSYDGEQVLALLADVRPDYPGVAEWRAWAEGEIKRRRQLEAAKQAYDGEAVLALLADVGPDYPDLAEWQAWAESEVERCRALQAAKQAHDGEWALALLADVDENYPQLGEWRVWAQQEIARRRKLEAAKQVYDGETVLALLADVGPSYPDLARWRAWAQGEIERHHKLQAAKQAYDGEAVLALLADVDDSYPELTEWRAWAETEITRRRALQAALQTYDGEQVLAILADAPTDYPRLTAWRAWATAEIERRYALQAAKQAYDGEQVLALLADVDESYPQLAEWKAWAQHEIERKQRLAVARQAYDGETVMTLLADVDQMYPQLAEWLAWAQQEVTRRQNLQDARLAYDGEKVLALLENVPADHPQLAEWRSWAQREIDRKQQLAAARQAYDGEAALTLLADVDERYPQLAEWRAWAQAWVERRHLLTEAWLEQRWQDVLQLLQEMPPDYPDRERLMRETGHLLWQQKHLEQVQAEFAAGRWEEVITRCDQVIAEGGDPALFDPLREQARQEQITDHEVSRFADEAEERVRAGAWGEAVALLEQALALRPTRRDLSARLAEAQRAWECERAIEQAQEAYVQEQWDDVLALLERWTAEDTRAANLYQNAQHRLIVALYDQVEADERNSRWEAVLTGLLRLQSLSVADEALPMRIERVRHEHQAALALDRSRQARACGRWKEVLAEANHALTLFPDRAEALALRQEAEQALALQRKRRLVLAVSLAGILIVLLLYSTLRHMIPDADIKSTVTAQAEAVATMAPTAFENVAAADSFTATTQVEATATARAMAIRHAAAADSFTATAQAEATATARAVAIRHTAAADSLTVVAHARLTDQASRPVATAPRPSLTATPTPQPTRTPTLRPTNTPTPRPTNTFTPRPTNTPTRLSAPVLLSPEDNASVSGQATFVWLWDGPALAANQAFELRLWKDGQPDHYGAAEPTRQTTITIWLGGATGVQQGGPGSYYWTVAVVEVNPYRRVGPEAPPRRLQVGGDNGSSPPPRPTWTPPTP